MHNEITKYLQFRNGVVLHVCVALLSVNTTCHRAIFTPFHTKRDQEVVMVYLPKEFNSQSEALTEAR